MRFSIYVNKQVGKVLSNSLTTLRDKVCHWLATCQFFSPGTLVSSTNKTDSHGITEILLKVALNIINQKKNFQNVVGVQSINSFDWRTDRAKTMCLPQKWGDIMILIMHTGINIKTHLRNFSIMCCSSSRATWQFVTFSSKQEICFTSLPSNCLCSANWFTKLANLWMLKSII